MSDTVLIQVIMAERLGVAVSWAIIGAIGLCATLRIAAGVERKGDLGWASLFLIAAGLLIIQWRTLFGYVSPQADVFVAIALGSFILSAIGIFIARALKAPVGHQLATLFAHIGILVASMAAGLLS